MNTLSVFVHGNGPILCLERDKTEQRCLLALPGREPTAWPHFVLPEPLPLRTEVWRNEIRQRSLPAPLLLAAAEEHTAAVEERGTGKGRSTWASMWTERLTQKPSDWLWRSRTEHDGMAIIHTAAAALFGALSTPSLAARSLRQGVIVLYCGQQTLTAFLVYRGRVYGVYEHSAQRDIPALLSDLREFRLAWLPDEVVRQSGGTGCVFLRPVPEEAEAFEPLFLVGPGRERLLAYGQGLAFQWDADWTPCYGLLAGLAARCA